MHRLCHQFYAPNAPAQGSLGCTGPGCAGPGQGVFSCNRPCRAVRRTSCRTTTSAHSDCHTQEGSVATAVAGRRLLLTAAVAGSLLLPRGPLVSTLPASAARLQQDPRLRPLQEFWQQLVHYLQQQLSDGFAPTLVFYGPGEILPSGAPGDPALEYNKQAARKCGPFTSGFEQPYAICPLTPGSVAADDTARDCCRHFAYAVPRSRYAFAAIDRQTSVVASSRLVLAATSTWQGILVHEMGHCIDFHAFPERYQLPKEAPPVSAAAAAALAAIDAEERDAELRADSMANALLMPLLGQQLCYDSRTHVQSLVPTSTACVPEVDAGDSSAADSRRGSPDMEYRTDKVVYMQHFPHPPVTA